MEDFAQKFAFAQKLANEESAEKSNGYLDFKENFTEKQSLEQTTLD